MENWAVETGVGDTVSEGMTRELAKASARELTQKARARLGAAFVMARDGFYAVDRSERGEDEP